MIDEKKLIEELKSLKITVTGLRAGKGVLAEFAKHYIQTVLRIIDEQPKTDWIPCEERLPSEENEECLVCKKNGVFMLIKWTKKGWNTYKCFDGTYFTESEIKDVLAWQPLPAPYKKEDDSNAG